MAAVAFAVSPLPSGAGPAVTPADCLVVASPSGEEHGFAGTSMTVEAVLSRRGEQIGRRLEVRTQRGTSISVALASDSFVGEPRGGRVLYAQRSPTGGSEIRALSLDSGCNARLMELQDVVRSVLESPADGSLFVHTVVGAERHDGGVTRINPAAGSAEQVVPPFVPAADFGRVYATQLAWAADGQTLAVQSCGAESCVTRLLAPDGNLLTYDTPHGAYVGLTDDTLIAFAADHGRPAELLAIDRRTGIARVVADEVFEAELSTAGPPSLLIETPAGRHEVLP
ncbi:MAG TPA: hypothetical protein VM305_05825 [Candidatus Limnocylindrales bacterium]|nr:hypothetical protein [Candidatus Limnocylindrales bacterium]